MLSTTSELKIVNWVEYTELLKKLYNEINYKNFDGIVAIGRGGCMIASYLASKLGIPQFYPVFVRHVGRGDDMKIEVHDVGQIGSLKGRLLVVDDWLYEGKAMKYVLNLLPKETILTTMVMYNRKGSDFKPDYVGEYLEADQREVFFPYDILG
ncbi:MAG: uncharacterized protein QG670_2555 [Thermoproteota archaeon]|nr:uncharacterized protein [Thermoproteota archaeon]